MPIQNWSLAYLRMWSPVNQNAPVAFHTNKGRTVGYHAKPAHVFTWRPYMLCVRQTVSPTPARPTSSTKYFCFTIKELVLKILNSLEDIESNKGNGNYSSLTYWYIFQTCMLFISSALAFDDVACILRVWNCWVSQPDCIYTWVEGIFSGWQPAAMR